MVILDERPLTPEEYREAMKRAIPARQFGRRPIPKWKNLRALTEEDVKGLKDV